MVKKGKRLETGESMVAFVFCCYDRVLETGKFIKKRSSGSGDGGVQSIKCLLYKPEGQITHVNKQPVATVTSVVHVGGGSKRCSSLASKGEA